MPDPIPMNLLYDLSSFEIYPPHPDDVLGELGLPGNATVERDQDGTPRRIVWEREK